MSSTRENQDGNKVGTYILIFKAARPQQIEVGKIGVLGLRPGYYGYVGSAFGPGGLEARIAHHLHSEADKRWHIDYLREYVQVTEVWLTREENKLEHDWATVLCRAKAATAAMPGFGSSDCACETHLFRFCHRPSVASFRAEFESYRTTCMAAP